MSAWKGFMTSFLDGFTGEGIFGDLRRPGAPDRIFEEEPEHWQPIEGRDEADESGLQGSGEKPENT